MRRLKPFTFMLAAALFFINGAVVSAAPDDGAKPADPLVAARAAANGDPLLDAMLTELARSKAELKMNGAEAPYYIEYRASDLEDISQEAAFGAMRQDDHVRIRLLRVVVRVGDYRQDSYFGGAMGETTLLPLDNDSIALRHQIWLATDNAYKAALEAYTQKQSILKQFSADEKPVDDFAKAPVAAVVEPVTKLSVDDAAWRKQLLDVTSLYREYPDIQSVTASARFTATNEYFVNSEGTVTRTGKTVYSVQLTASTQAADGMRLSRSPGWTVGRVEELPSGEKLMADSKETLESLVALRKAPIVEEEYRGPVLFDADAANDVVATLIGANVLGFKPQLGRPNRTVGGFATSYKQRVLPTFLSVVDDPTLKEFAGKSLIGSYNVDSEGVKAQAVDLIDKGMLQNYLLGRAPIRDFTTSNGHGRATPSGSPSPNLGVLLLKSSEPQTPDALKQRMLQMAKDGDRPFVYHVVTLGPGNTPRLLYRVYAKDGHEELVRGAVFNELDLRSLRGDITAAGNDSLVSNRQAGASTTIISPSILFDELEVRRANQSKDKLPEYPAPPISNK